MRQYMPFHQWRYLCNKNEAIDNLYRLLSCDEHTIVMSSKKRIKELGLKSGYLMQKITVMLFILAKYRQIRQSLMFLIS